MQQAIADPMSVAAEHLPPHRIFESSTAQFLVSNLRTPDAKVPSFRKRSQTEI
jgi:hypothetical protein